MDNVISLSSNFTYGDVQPTTGGGTYNSTPYWDTNTYRPLVQEYYYNWYHYWQNEYKISKAFKLAQKLIDKKLIKEPAKVKDFIELVNELVEII